MVLDEKRLASEILALASSIFSKARETSEPASLGFRDWGSVIRVKGLGLRD